MSFSDYTVQEKKVEAQASIHLTQERNEMSAELPVRALTKVIGHESGHTIDSRRNESNASLARQYQGVDGLELLRRQTYETLKDPDARVFQGYASNPKWNDSMSEEEKVVGQWMQDARGRNVYKPHLVTCHYSEKTGCIVIINPANARDWGTAFPSDIQKFDRLKMSSEKVTRSRQGSFLDGLNNRPDLGRRGALGMGILQGIDRYLANRGVSLTHLADKPSAEGRFPWEDTKPASVELSRTFNVAGHFERGKAAADILPAQRQILEKSGLLNLADREGNELDVVGILRTPAERERLIGQIEAAYDGETDLGRREMLKAMIDASHAFLGLEQGGASATNLPDSKKGPELKRSRQTGPAMH